MMIEKSYQKVPLDNKLYAEAGLFQDPDYSRKLSEGRTPNYLWIGYIDSHFFSEL
jgi:hypothetical protein